MGDTPSLWVELKHCRVDLTSAVSPRQKSSSNKDSQRQKLHETLSLKKLQFLDHLYLVCSSENCIEILHMIAGEHPTIRKLSLEVEWMDMYHDIHRISKALVKFVEVDLTYCGFFSKFIDTMYDDSDGQHNYYPPKLIDKEVTGSLMRTLLYVATHQTGSKLKMITVCGESIESEDDDLDRQRVTSCISVICEYRDKYDIEVNLKWVTWVTISEEEEEDYDVDRDDASSDEDG